MFMLPEGTAISAFIGGAISKVINDGVDYTKPTIRSVLNDKNNRNYSTKIYRIIEKSLNTITDKKFKNTDKLYDAIEKIFIEFKNQDDTIESVKCGLCLLCSDVSDQKCENFLEKFYEEICRDDDLYKEVIMTLQQKGIKISQEEFQKINEKLDNLTEIVSSRNDNENDLQKREPVKSRTQEYADKWNENMFLNNFDEWDENAGVNVKLSDVYVNEHLPHFIWGNNKNESDKLDVLLSQYITKSNDNKMLLILGQPGIGKSTLITWITVNCTDRINDILVYRFASDLGNTDWKNGKISNRVLEELGLNYSDLNGKILILDGFDEVSIEASRRRDILDSLYGDWLYCKAVKKFSLVITCRENYVQDFERLKCKYITLQPWNEVQIRSFYMIFQEKIKNNVSERTIEKLLENREILGIPLILYLVLALNISIDKEGSIVDVYDKIFSLDGGIYDRCIDFKSFSEKHRISEIKKQIHQISREIAFWMFENNSEEAIIPHREYQKICSNVMKEQQINEDTGQDFLIGNFFKMVKYCEGVNSEELYFVHRSIYEYFVAETICGSIENHIIDLTEDSQKKFAGSIVVYLKQGQITFTIGLYIKHIIIKLLNMLNKDKRSFYKWIQDAINNMIMNGMFFYTNLRYYRYSMSKELQCFKNFIQILRSLLDISGEKYIMKYINRSALARYIQYCIVDKQLNSEQNKVLNFSYMDLSHLCLAWVHFGSVNLENTIFYQTTLKGADLEGSNLEGAILRGSTLLKTNLKRTRLAGADLSYAALIEANFIKAEIKTTILGKENVIKLDNADMENAIFDETQVDILEEKYNLQGIKVFIIETEEYISYEEYCKRKQQENM